LKALHPDTGGDAEAFVWAGSQREFVYRQEQSSLHKENVSPAYSTVEYAERVPYDPALGHVDEFVMVTMRALSVGQHTEEPHRSVLGLLIDCPVDDHVRATAEQEHGATYKQLAAIAHDASMSKRERFRWYEVARSVPLSKKHASHTSSGG
jgi:hypothetical protein